MSFDHLVRALVGRVRDDVRALRSTGTDKAAIRFILRNAPKSDWTLQGFGMLRFNLSPDLRLHVWSEADKVPGVSEIHTHPWDFRSLCVAGCVRNRRYTERAAGPDRLPMLRQTIQCGVGACLKGDPELVNLYAERIEYINADRGARSYRQDAREIHSSHPEDGTVTLVQRTFKADTEHAYVYWPAGTEWVTAEPRTATPEEVERITQNALNRWFR